MLKKKQYPYEMKLAIVQECLNENVSLRKKSEETGVSHSRIREWLSQYKSQGNVGLKNTNRNSKYSSKTKNLAVEEYLSGGTSLVAVCEKYSIRSTYQLRDWIRKRQNNEVLKSTGPGKKYKTKGRKTSLEERIEIVQECLRQSKNYNKIAEQYNVSYRQVYSWTQKYEQTGIEALHDGRGRKSGETEV